MAWETMSRDLTDVTPRETVGRDTIARFNAQYRGAALKSLKILEGGAVDRVYCDYHDDFVVREIISQDKRYHFYQVKTKSKKNHLYSLRELFGIYKAKRLELQSAEDVASSYIGLLLLHVKNFENSCVSVNFLTNIQFDDTTVALISAIRNSETENKHLKILMGIFDECFSDNKSASDSEKFNYLQRLNFEPGLVHLHPDDNTFSALARNTIFEYSEVDLRHSEAEKIVSDLISLIEKKSFTHVLGQITEAELDENAGVGLSDLLSILCISKGAYDRLAAGGDAHAIRNASIIQRKLGDAGATEQMINYASDCKVKWDNWVRSRRHYISELDYTLFLGQLDDVVKGWIGGYIPMSSIKEQISDIMDKNKHSGFLQSIDQDLVFGGLLARVVKSEVQ